MPPDANDRTGRGAVLMACRKDTENLLTSIRAAGAVTKRSRSNHWKVYVDGVLVTTIASSSSDVRSIRNVRARLKRAGLKLE